MTAGYNRRPLEGDDWPLIEHPHGIHLEEAPMIRDRWNWRGRQPADPQARLDEMLGVLHEIRREVQVVRERLTALEQRLARLIDAQWGPDHGG